MDHITKTSNITKITTRCNYTVRSISYLQPRWLRERREMTHYQQTLIIPRTKQRFPESPRSRRPAYRPQPAGNNVNRELNSILAFFD